MTFIEALKANETEEVECLEYGEPYARYGVCKLKFSSMGIDIAWQRTWRLVPKPQVVEFDCEWMQHENIYFPFSGAFEFIPNLKKMSNGKRWRVRCEEII